MSDLSPIIADATKWFIEEIQKVRLGRYAGRIKPHKLLILLAVIDMAEDGLLNANRIYFDDDLLSRFEKYFGLYASEQDWLQAAMPFFHLRTSDFWLHKVIPGRERFYAKVKSVGWSTKRVTDNVEYAFLDDRAFLALNDPVARKVVYDSVRSRLERLTEKQL